VGCIHVSSQLSEVDSNYLVTETWTKNVFANFHFVFICTADNDGKRILICPSSIELRAIIKIDLLFIKHLTVEIHAKKKLRFF